VSYGVSVPTTGLGSTVGEDWMARLSFVLVFSALVSTGVAPATGLTGIRIAHADDKFAERDRELAKIGMERDRELSKAYAEYQREISEAERDAYKERDPYKAADKRAEKLREAELRYREKTDTIRESFLEKSAKFRRH
jgi:hypothetical protein